EVATGTQITTAPAWLAAGAQPLLLERRLGEGIVTLATFDWNQEPVAGWSGTGPLLRQLIARAVFGSSNAGQTTLYAGGMGPVPFGVQSTIGTRSSALSSTLGNLPGLDLPSLQLTGALVLLYVLLVGPVNYLVLGAMRRRALAWVTVPLIAVIAAGGAYGAGSRSGIRVDLDHNNIVLPGMTAFALSGFATESLTSAPQLAAHVKLVNGKLTGTIENHSNLDFTDAVLIMGDNFQTVGALRPGATTSVSLDVKPANQSGQPVYTRIYGSTFF